MVHSAVNSTIDSLPITLGAEWQHLEQLLHAGDASETQFMQQVADRIQNATTTYNDRYGNDPMLPNHLDNHNSYTVHYLGTRACEGQDHLPIVVVHIGGASNTGDLRLYMGMDLSGDPSEEHLCYIAHIEDNAARWNTGLDHGQIHLYNLDPSHSTLSWTQTEFGSRDMNELDRVALCGLTQASGDALAAQVATAADAATLQANAARSTADSAAAEAERLHDAVRTAQAALQGQDAAIAHKQELAADAHATYMALDRQVQSAGTRWDQASHAKGEAQDAFSRATELAGHNKMWFDTYHGCIPGYLSSNPSISYAEAQHQTAVTQQQLEDAQNAEQARRQELHDIRTRRDSAHEDWQNLLNELNAAENANQGDLDRAQRHAEDAWEGARDRAQELATAAEAAEETARTLGGTHTQV